MQGGESWASAFLVVVGIEKKRLDLQFMVCYISCKQRENIIRKNMLHLYSLRDILNVLILFIARLLA